MPIHPARAHPRPLVLRNARIHTFDDSRPSARAIALVDGKVAAFDDAAIALADRGARAIDPVSYTHLTLPTNREV